MTRPEGRAYDPNVTQEPPTWESASEWPSLASLDLDDLLTELRARALSAQQSQDRLTALLDAVVAVSSDLDLATVLGRIVRSACHLVDARYGALGVLGHDGEHLTEFVTHGMSAQERAAIGELPRGKGLLGLLIRHPEPVRVHEIAEHPDSYGFPPNHPPMKSFLGTPIRIREQVFGNLYLSEKQGASEFTSDDQAILVALAAAAGVAIENARLYDRTRRQRQWYEAIAAVTQAFLQEPDQKRALQLMAERAGDLAQADLALVALYDEDGRLLIGAVNGLSRDARIGEELDAASWRELLAGQQAFLLTEHQPGPPKPVVALREMSGLDEAGPTALLPLAVGDREPGFLCVAWSSGFDAVATQEWLTLATFGQQSGLGLAAAGVQRTRARMERLEDRDRIARDMHDHVIQRLFATGLLLQSVGRVIDNHLVRERLDSAVDELDAAIKDIRQTIFALHRPAAGHSVADAVRELVVTSSASWDFTPRVTIDGPLESLSQDTAADLLAVVREGLANVARHAHATQVDVTVSSGQQVVVKVADDGVGTRGSTRLSGLANLAQRATRLGGSLTIEARQPHGTVLSWQVPEESALDDPS
jgi:signal transduction histidine kinase